MNRDMQIELMRNAKERVQGYVASWIQDPRVQETLTKNRENAKRLKAAHRRTTRVKACG